MPKTEFNVHAVWSITKKTFMNTKDIESEEFETTFPNFKYYIALEPDIANSKYVLIRFGPDDFSEININIDTNQMNLYIKSANYQENLLLDNTPPKCRNGGVRQNFRAFIKREDILNPEKNFFVNGILTIEIRGVLFYESPKLNLGEVLWDQPNKDFTFVVGTKTIKAHKFVIRPFSSVFAAAIDSNKNELKIENFEYSVVYAAVRLCYELNFFYNDQNFKIIEFTNTYDMPRIKEQVENKLAGIINAENVINFANKSIELNAEILPSFCVNYFCDCIKNGKPFGGNLNDLHPEIKCLVFKHSFCRTQTS
uniref:BTB domain-containing protein n=1 Tax=Panagrolaimus sp. ES5 TaxID=591445 RepID=A0AC34G3H6_9BILA